MRRTFWLGVVTLLIGWLISALSIVAQEVSTDTQIPVVVEESIEGDLGLEEEVDVPLRPDRRLRFFYHRGLESYEGGKYRQAIEYFDEVVSLDPSYRRADYYRREAWNQLAVGNIEDETQASEVLVEDLRVEFDRGKDCMRQGDYQEAVGAFQAVLKVNPSHQEARRLLGEARLQLDKQSLAEEEALAAQIMQEETELRQMAQEEEDLALRRAYDDGRTALERGELEKAERSFTGIHRQRANYRRTDYFLRRLDHEIQKKHEIDSAISDRQAIQQYTLGPEDSIKVVVRNHPEFSFDARVEESGELIVPLTNEIVMVDGLTRDELAEEFRTRMSLYIDDPFVKVFITGYGSKKYYVLQPDGGGSEYIMNKANMTLWDCMFTAGIPMLDEAALRRIQVITPHPTHPTHRWINVYAMLYQGKMKDNIRIEPGTIIYYPMLAIDKFSQIIEKVTQPISDLADLGNSYEDWDDFRKKYLR